MGVVCVQWKFPLDTLDGGHMSESGRGQWKFPLDTNHVRL